MIRHPVDQWCYRRGTPDCGQVRVMVEELERIEGHSPAMVTDAQLRINIIPSRKWPPDPYVVSVICHESLHIVTMVRESPEAGAAIDNFPKKPEDLNELFARGGVYGWDLKRMSENPKWKELVKN